MIYRWSLNPLERMVENRDAFVEEIISKTGVDLKKATFAFDSLIEHLKREFGEKPSFAQIQLFIAYSRVWLNASAQDKQRVESLCEEFSELRG